MAVAAAKGLFNDHVSSPALLAWSTLKNRVQSSVARADFPANLWNTSVCSVPFFVGGGVAGLINGYAHAHWVHKSPSKPVTSFFFTTVSCIAGASVSFVAIKALSAIGITLYSFSADTALCLITLQVVVLTAAIPISKFFKKPLETLFATGMCSLTTGAITGYFGDRSLYAVGALSALFCAVECSFVSPSFRYGP